MRLLYFYKDDCQPCQEKKPLVAQLARDAGVALEAIDAAVCTAAAEWYRVKAVPTLVVVDDAGTRLFTFFGGMIDPARILRVLGH